MSAPTIEAMAGALVREGAAPESAALLAGMVLDRLSYPAEGGTPAVLDAHGRPALGVTGAPVTVPELMAGFRRELPLMFAKATTSTTAASPGETLTARVAREARDHQARKAGGDAPNPWATGSINITAQVAMQARDPARAARLKSQAGAK